jgi:hypothetical protein
MPDLRRAFVAVVAFTLFLTACSATSSDEADIGGSAPARLQIVALSTRPELVSGGDVLVSIEAADGVIDGIDVRVGDRDVTSAFAEEDGALVGLVSGLPEGPSQIRAARDGDQSALDVVNHPITGPLFSGPHLAPFVCKTEQFGLGPPTDDDCSAPAKTEVRDVEGVSTTIETGVIDRSIYTIAFPNSGWNGRLVYRFGGGCGTSYSQGTSLVNAADPALLQKGYAVATSTLDTYQSVCNEVLSAEVALMTKEHFVETYGVPDFTIGDGGSGGAIQQLQIAQNYPGILDALSPAVPFPDAITTAQTVTDCGLLIAYYGTPSGSQLDPEQQRAIAGHRTFDTCRLWASSFLPNIDPTVGCDPSIPRDEIYDAAANPDGVRCTLQDSAVNLYGIDPATGFAARVLDNEGVVYGAQAFEAGVITFDQLIDLNENIGGYDVDGAITADRQVIPAEWAERVYSTGRVTEGGGLVDLPIVLTNVYTDALGDIHDRQRAFAIRERLSTAEGAQADNVVIFTLPSSGDLTRTLTGAVGDTSATISLLDEWLTAAAKDTSGGTRAEQLARNRPASAVDTCVTPEGETIAAADVYDVANACTQAYPVAADARRVAGAPLRDDVVKCRTEPVDAMVFTSPIATDQAARLAEVFPGGVCDWSEPSVGQVALAGTWLTFDEP